MDANNKKIGIIGRVDPQGLMFDGQTVKTRTLWRMLGSRYGFENILVVETFDYKKHPLRVMNAYRKCLTQCNDIIVLLSHNGRRLFFPLLKKQAERNNKRIYHDLIGCSLARDVCREPYLASQLKSFKVNWIESPNLVKELADLGIHNCKYLPNFKQIEPISACELSFPQKQPRCLCTFSRVTKQKGIIEAIEAVELLSRRDGKNSWSLDIYGPIDSAFQDTFFNILNSASCVQYCGSVNPEDSVSIIKKYWALLFPTKYETEGFPGTIIDALSAGVPIVASRWPYYEDMLEDNQTGTSFRFGGGSKELFEAIDKLLASEGNIMAIKNNCLKRAEEYSASAVFDKIVSEIESA